MKNELRRVGWSTDGTRLAFLQETAKKRYRLMTAAVGRATIER